MLYEQLDLAEVEPLDGGLRWLVPALVAAAAGSGALLFFLIGQPLYGGLFVAGFVAMLVAAFVIDRRSSKRIAVEPIILPDLALVGTALAVARDPAAMTAADGTLQSINPAYKARFGARSPVELGKGKQAQKALARLCDTASREGECSLPDIPLGGAAAKVHVVRAGANNDLLLWRFEDARPPDPLSQAAERMSGAMGERLANSDVLGVLIDSEGRLAAANRLFTDRAFAGKIPTDRPPLFADLIETSEEGALRLLAEGPDARPLRLVSVPIDPVSEDNSSILLLFDWNGGTSVASSTNVQVLLEMLPIGLALVDRDGRFLMMNKAFRQAGGIRGDAMPTYPGDLVVKEDKAAVADAVRRNARGPSMSGDLPVRLAHQSAEPVALTVAGLRGLGDAAVLLLLKDNSEEAKLKRQVAQATKMQVVGQLAGGVAHDFNNILTAIIGHCDLMLM